MHYRSVLPLLCGLLLALVGPAQSQSQTKRPLTHKDYDSWRSIQGATLSPDGTHVAYAITAQEGDGELVVHNIKTSQEFRQPRGSRPGLALAGGRGTVAAGPVAHFSPDGKLVTFSIYPSKDRTKGKPTTSSGLGILDVTTGKLTTLEKVRSYQGPEKGPALLVYHREPAGGMPTVDTDKAKEKTPTFKGKGKLGTGGTTNTSPRTSIASELVLRNLLMGQERTFADVTEYSLSRDGQLLIYAMAGKSESDQGVFAAFTDRTAPPIVLRSGAGRHGRITWDDKQQQVAFFHTKPANPNAAGSRAESRLFHWKRPKDVPVSVNVPMGPSGPTLTALQSATNLATELVPNSKTPFQPGCEISEGAGLNFSLDGERLYFSVSTAPPLPMPKVASGEDRVAVELWHFKDDFIQPMQKVRYSATRSYRAVFCLNDRTCRQISDDTLASVNPGPGDWATGSDDRAYRSLVGSEETAAPADVSLVNIRTGQRKPILKKHNGGVSQSPGGKYVLSFDGKDWHSTSVPDGKRVNLTAKLNAKFAYELHDTANNPPAYGLGGWTNNDARVLIYDRYDIWEVAPDGSASRNLTGGMGRKSEMQLRVVNLETRERSLDPSKPLLVRAESERTRDTGFYRVPFDGSPKLLIMGARSYNPLKIVGGRMLLTISTFYDFPDLYSADLDFKEIKRVSDANKEKAGFVWGKAELIAYKNSDGMPLSGMLVKPENFDPTKKYPMMVYIYERLSQNLHRFVNPSPGTSINPSYYASNGYLVLMPDIAYDIGYPGKSAMKCVLPAVQAVVDKGWVDEKAIGIQGHSWGGYQTAYLITQTTRFKAASAGAPVANMTSAYGGIRWGTGLPRQFQYEKTQSRIGGTLWQYPTRFLENSPLFHADQVKTPLLMLHNDQDEAVPWQQGIEYYLALRRLNKEVYMFNYPGEKHGLTKRANQRDYTVRLQQFFDHHLKGAPKPAWMEKGIPYTPPPGGGFPGRTTPPVTTGSE